MTDYFFEFLKIALGEREYLSHPPTNEEWEALYYISQKQSIAAFLLCAVEKLNERGCKPPITLLYKWIGLSERIRLHNELIITEAAQLTAVFEREGHKTAILKGQANARLYPQPMSRQPGDIDIWVDGGKNKVIDTVRKLGLLENDINKKSQKTDELISYHHINLKENEKGINVEVHFRPSSGNLNPNTNKKLQSFLEEEIQTNTFPVSEGFRVPSIRFALVMQLAHIQRHLIGEGVGLRQVIDYYYLLKSDNNNQRDDVSGMLNAFGLQHMAGALLWLLHEKMGLEDRYLFAPVDEKRGRMLLENIMEGGNFGHHYTDNLHKGSWDVIRRKRRHRCKRK